MILDDKELNIFSLYMKNELIYFYTNDNNEVRWDCNMNQLNYCEECHFALPANGDLNRCVIVDDLQLRTQLQNKYPKEFEC